MMIQEDSTSCEVNLDPFSSDPAQARKDGSEIENLLYDALRRLRFDSADAEEVCGSGVVSSFPVGLKTI